ncbi:MAG TPA: S41 family peptidase [Bryobacteraceae bacterium]|nr:S41 family peptidase [Bryobacteraceae bacterium]
MKKLALTVSLAFLAFGAASPVAPVPSFSDPALSPDKSEIAFVSGGDIWTVSARGGEARLLISHPATESRPLYSPDGSKLAFTSTRTGNGDIYVLTFATGQLKRLTFSDAPEALDAWSRDGKWLYFSSNGNDVGGANDIFRVSVNGGTPVEVTRDRFFSEYRGAPSPDGMLLAFIAKGNPGQWWRHGHSHLDETEIWTRQIGENGTYRRVVEEDARQGWPMWAADGRAIFYTSDRTGSENVFLQPLDGKGAARQISHFRDGRLIWPSISYDGSEIVFERGFGIWRLDTKNGTASQIPITLRGAPASPAVTHLQLTQFSDLALSPDGKKIAVIAHGEVFATSAAEGGDAIRITRTSSPETNIRWSPDSNRVIYISARNGHDQIFEYDLTKNVEAQLTSSDQDDAAPAFSPDGKVLAFVRGEHELCTLIVNGKKEQTLASGFLENPVLAWSPDGKFIAYTSVGAKSFRNVNIVSASGGAAQPATFLANGETATRIAWSPDGEYLLFDTAQRSEPSQMARVELIPHLPKFREDQFRDLFRNTQPDHTPTRQPEQAPEKSSDVVTSDGTTAAAMDRERQAVKKMQPVRVVFDGIRDRLSFLPLGFDSGQPVISPDGKTMVFVAVTGNERNLYSYSLDELATGSHSPRQLTSTATPKSHYQFTPDSKQLFYLDGGHVTSMPVETHAPKTINVTASMDIDFDAEKMAAFEEGWTLLNKRFWDPEFNGKNWTQIRDTYLPYVEGSRTPDEMRRVMSLMIGELNSSHSGINPAPRNASTPATPFSPAVTPVGRLGLRFEREPCESGKGLIIREVIPLGPAALEGSIKPGEMLRAVDNEKIGPETNLDELLESKVDHRVVLQIGSAADLSKTREAIVRPVSLAVEKGLLYRAWVESNRAYVERLSGGKLGYVHILDMSSQSLNQLFIDLDAQNQTKQGVIIDIRDNNGGFVNQYAIDVFTRKNYLTMTPRGGEPAPARPYLGQRALGLPTVLVTNQGSLSDAEDFTEGYRSLKLGKVIGEPTAGWIVYTYNTPLIDGSVIRVPHIRVQAADGQTMEMHPRPVDVLVSRPAGEASSGKDSQLDRAVKELLAELPAQ